MAGTKCVLLWASLLGWLMCVSAQFCSKLGSYSFACRFDGNFLVVSTFPCQSAGKVGVTLINENTMKVESSSFIYSDVTIKSVNKSKSILLLVTNHTKGPNVGKLHIIGYTYSVITQKTKIFDVYFFLEYAAECLEMFLGASHCHPHSCETSLRTGDFSALCITKKGVMDPSLPGIALVSLDPCAHPYSVTSLLFIQNQRDELLKTYTANKTDAFVGIKDGASSGMKLVMNYYESGLKLNVVLKFGSSDQNAVELLNDYFFPDDSLMCPLSKCKLVTPAKQICQSKIITGEKKVKTLNTTISIDPCKPLDVAGIALQLEGHKRSIDATLKLEPIHEEDGVTQLQFSPMGSGSVKNGGGFVPEDGGHVSLAMMHAFDITEFIHEEEAAAIVVIINRHYPLPQYTFPLARVEFIRTKEGCPATAKHKEKRTVVKAVVGVFVFLIIVVITTLAIIWWRRKRKQGDGGLPYQMELDSDDPDDMKM